MRGEKLAALKAAISKIDLSEFQEGMTIPEFYDLVGIDYVTSTYLVKVLQKHFSKKFILGRSAAKGPFNVFTSEEARDSFYEDGGIRHHMGWRFAPELDRYLRP